MNTKRVALIAGALATALTAGRAAVLTFDDVSTTTLYETVPDGYGGLNWDQMAVVNGNYHPVYGYGVVSGDYAAFNLAANVVTVSDGAFDFIGAYLTSAADGYVNMNVKGYNGAAIIYDQTIVVGAPTWFNFNFNNIDSLVLDSGGYHFTMDDFTYVIPEPSSVAMAGLVSVLGVFIRRRFML